MCSSRLTRRAFLQKSGAAATAMLLMPGNSERAWAIFSSPAQMDGLTQIALDEARKAGAGYADIRLVRTRSEDIYARNDRIAFVGQDDSFGYGIRCLTQGAWGFASSNNFAPDAVRETARLAAQIARASALVKTPLGVRLAPEAAHMGSYQTPRVKDPFAIGLDDKSKLLLDACAVMRKTPEVKVATAYLGIYATDKHFASSEGARLHIDSLITSGGLHAMAAGTDDRQERRYEIEGANGGWEHIEQGDLSGNAPRVALEAKEKLSADTAPVGTFDLITEPDHLYLPIHESIGHATELDRLLGFEADFAGTSWVDPKQVGTLRFASPHITVVADNLQPYGIASTGWDDDGVACQKWDIVREGIFVGCSDSREFAALQGEPRSHGSNRAEGWNAIPIVRIANVGIAPGPEGVTPDDLIADVKDGVHFSGTGTWSIDQRRLNMQFGSDMCYRIRHGKKAEMLKDVIYHAIAPQFWGSCDGLAGPSFYKATGVLNCGKGQPEQIGRMTHGTSHARFRGVEFGKAQG